MYGINPKTELEIFNNLLMNKVKVSNEDYYQVIRSKKTLINLHIFNIIIYQVQTIFFLIVIKMLYRQLKKQI